MKANTSKLENLFPAADFLTLNEERHDGDATWFELYPDKVYPAAIEWLQAHYELIEQYSKESDGALITLALSGDQLAAFVIRCRMSIVQEILSVKSEGYTVDNIKGKEAPSEVVRRFVTEILQQKYGRVGIHIHKDDWKYVSR